MQELIRAGAALPAWMWVLWYLQNKGVLTASTRTLFAVSFGISALMFSVSDGKEAIVRVLPYFS